MDLEIVKKNGETRRLSEFGVVYDFVVGSIQIDNFAERLEGRSGFVDYGADYASRRITVPMKFKFKEMHEYAHYRDDLYGLLTDTDSYYIREMRRPQRLQYKFVDFGHEPEWKKQTKDTYVNGKQFLVRMVSELTPEQIYDGGEVEIEFETTELPFAETVYTTDDLHINYTEKSGLFGLAEDIDQGKYYYRFRENYFSVYNAGNTRVEPETMYFEIVLRNVSSSGSLTISNQTTGERFEFTGNLYGDTLTISQMQVKVGSTNRLRDTNRKFISLLPGDNDISISGATFDEVDFNFKFYYK